jgi:type I restriction enzyme R subunit
MTPEEQARSAIDALLAAAGWAVQDFKAADIHAARGVAIREFPLHSPLPPGEGQGVRDSGFADYLLYLDGKAAGVIEAKKRGATLTGVEIQSAKYAQGLPTTLPARRRPLPFLYESTGLETHFTNALDPEPRARNVFAFHRPETLAEWLNTPPPFEKGGTGGFEEGPGVRAPSAAHEAPAPYELGTFQHRVRHMPPLVTEWSDFKLWPAQITAIRNVDTRAMNNERRGVRNVKH